MRNGTRVKAHFPNLSDGPGIVPGGYGVIQEEFGLTLRGISFEGKRQNRPKEDSLGAALGQEGEALFESIFAADPGGNDHRPPFAHLGRFFFHILSPYYLNIRYSDKCQE
jgi:hypothetical protein